MQNFFDKLRAIIQTVGGNVVNLCAVVVLSITIIVLLFIQAGTLQNTWVILISIVAIALIFGSLMIAIVSRPDSFMTVSPVPPDTAETNYLAYNGEWYGLHLTICPSGHGTKIVRSRHTYDLNVSRKGRVTGSLVDDIDGDTTSHKCKIEGWIHSLRVLFEIRSKASLNFYKLEVYYRPITDKALDGFIVGHNHRGDLFVTRIVLRRYKPSDKDLDPWLSKCNPPYTHDTIPP